MISKLVRETGLLRARDPWYNRWDASTEASSIKSQAQGFRIVYCASPPDSETSTLPVGCDASTCKPESSKFQSRINPRSDSPSASLPTALKSVMSCPRPRNPQATLNGAPPATLLPFGKQSYSASPKIMFLILLITILDAFTDLTEGNVNHKLLCRLSAQVK